MEILQNEALQEFMGILERAVDEAGHEIDNPRNRLQTFPSTNPDFESCQLREVLTNNLEARLGAQVDEAVASREASFRLDDNVDPCETVDQVVAQLTASQTFQRVVDESCAAVQRAAGLLPTGSAPIPASAAGAATIDTSKERGVELSLRRGGVSGSDAELEGAHAKKVPRRDDSWVGIFEIFGAGGAAAGAFTSPRVDVERVLEQLKAGLAVPGSVARSVEALGLLAEANPELFQFGNHWPLFRELARLALDSADPAVHAKAMTLHWVMYEKSIGMSAADMCEGVLAHAKRRYAGTVHLLAAADTAAAAPAPRASSAFSGEEGGGGRGGGRYEMMIVGDSELACAAREARALHGMLTTIHEVFQHLPERRVWNIVNDFLYLFGDDPITFGSSAGASKSSSDLGARVRVDGGDRVNCAAEPGAESGVSTSSKRSISNRGPQGDLACPSDTIVAPSHFLAVAGRVEDWLPGWLRALPTGRLVRAVKEAGLVTAMTRRCDARGRILFCHPGHQDAATASEAAAEVGANAAAAVLAAVAVPCEQSLTPPLSSVRKTLVRHRMRASAGPSGALRSSNPLSLGRALWLPVDALERALTKQAVSFLGIITAHCRCTLRPYLPLENEPKNERTRGVLPVGAGAEELDTCDESVRQGLEVVATLVRAASHEMRGARVPVAQSSPLHRRVPTAWTASSSVGRLSLEYVRRLAIAAAGAEPTPFTGSVVDELFAPLADTEICVVGGQADGRSTEADNSRTVLWEAKPEALGALVDIAGALLSSRGAPSSFFIEGPAGPEASPSLLTVVRTAASLAKRACFLRGVRDEMLDDSGSGVEPREEGTGSPLLRGNHLLRLAVNFSCALSAAAGMAPKMRAVALKALLQCDYLQVVGQLTATLGLRNPAKMASGKIGDEQDHSCHGAGNYNRDSGRDAITEEHTANLRDRLLWSLVKWARDLTGVNCLRQAGLVGTCSSFLSRELALRHLHPESREESPDARPLALAERLAMFPEGFEALICADGGIADGVDTGLRRLSGLGNLAELLESRTANLPPPPRSATSLLSAEGVDRQAKCELPDVDRRVAVRKPVVGSDPQDLRCLDFARRFSSCCFGTAGRGKGRKRGARRVRGWWNWAITMTAPLAASADRGGSAPREGSCEDGEVTEDVRVAAMELVAMIATDPTVATEIEARWSLVEALARQKADEAGGGIKAELNQSVAGRGLNGENASLRGRGVGAVGMECGNFNDEDARALDFLGIVEPSSLKLARLSVSLTCLGGPTEERQSRMRRLRGAEVSAALAGHFRSGLAPLRAGAAASRNMSPPLAKAVDFPSGDFLDHDWWEAAARSVSVVTMALSKPKGVRRVEALAVLTESLSRRSLFFQQPVRCNSARCSTDASVDEDNSDVDDWAAKVAAAKVIRGGGDADDQIQAVMQELCFSYACSLDLVDVDRRDGFAAAWRATMATADDDVAAAAALAPPTKALVDDGQDHQDPFAAADRCDWFAAVVLLVSGSDGEIASAVLRKALRHVNRAIFLWPVAGERFTAAATEASSSRSTHRALVVEEKSTVPHVASIYSDSLAGASSSISDECSCGAAAAMSASSGDPPLLVLAALVEYVLEEEMPLLAAALRASGWAVAPLAARWMRQCLLGVVDWPEAVAYMVLALLRGHDYQVYFVVALLRVAQSRVVDASSAGLDLSPLLLEGEALEGFQLEASLGFMEDLEQRHRPRCLAATQAFLARVAG